MATQVFEEDSGHGPVFSVAIRHLVLLVFGMIWYNSGPSFLPNPLCVFRIGSKHQRFTTYCFPHAISFFQTIFCVFRTRVSPPKAQDRFGTNSGYGTCFRYRSDSFSAQIWYVRIVFPWSLQAADKIKSDRLYTELQAGRIDMFQSQKRKF